MRRYKIALIGETNSGKTTLANYINSNEFAEITNSTVGAAFFAIKHDEKILELWDTSGQEKYAALTSQYYRNASIMLLVFDASNYRFENKLKYYLDETKLKVNEGIDYKIIVICNKIDLVDKSKLAELKKCVNDVVDFSNSRFNVIDYIEVSCKNKIGRDKLFERINSITDEQYKKKVENENKYNSQDSEVISFDSNYKESKCCPLG